MIIRDWGIEFESAGELLSNPNIRIWEDNDKYYVRLKPQHLYDDLLYVIDKKTKKISYDQWLKFEMLLKDKLAVTSTKEALDQINT